MVRNAIQTLGLLRTSNTLGKGIFDRLEEFYFRNAISYPLMIASYQSDATKYKKITERFIYTGLNE